MRERGSTSSLWIYPGLVALLLLGVAAALVYGELGAGTTFWTLVLLIVLMPVSLYLGLRAAPEPPSRRKPRR